MGILNERIRSRRQHLGYTLLYIADQLGVKEATVQRYESGEIKNIKHETVVAIAKILHCDPAYLMGWQDDPSPASSDLRLSDLEQEIILEYRQADELDRQMVLRILKIAEKTDAAKMA